MQVFHLGGLKNQILSPNQYSDPVDQLSYDIDKHESLSLLFDFRENINIENTFRSYESFQFTWEL